MPIYVPGCGNPSAKLMIVGEAPGPHEETQGFPFAGPSGEILNDCLEDAGISRPDVYLTNVVKIRPPNNEIYRLHELGTKIDDFLPQLWQEVETINPNCILAVGGTALKALTGFTGIQNYRGSILPNCHNALPKVVATIHPASLLHGENGEMRSWRDRSFILFDIKRAVQQSTFRDYRPPDRLLLTAKNSLDIHRFFDQNKGKRRLVYDIETFKSIPMCIGFAFSKWQALSIPLFDIASGHNPEGIPMHDVVHIWQMVDAILSDPSYDLIGHNLKFDQGRLEEIGFSVRNPYFDTQLGFHTLFSELPKKLQFISSIITEEPYYKDELEEYNPKRHKLKKRLLYNAKDCAVTYEVFEEEEKLLREFDLFDWHMEKIQPLHKFYFNLERRGMRVDMVERKRLIKKYERYTRLLHNQTTKDLGYDLNVNSWKQVGATLYGNLRCPVRKDVAEPTLEALILNAVKDERRRHIIRNILKERKARKTVSTYVGSNLAADRRAYTTVNITGTESGRTSNSKPKAPVVAEPQGFAFQTLTKYGEVGSDVRKMFIPDPGKCFIECDGGQAEDRVVCVLARDEEGLRILNRKDFKRNKFGVKDDRHTLTAMLVLSMAFEEIDDIARQLGKKTRHAGNYGMKKARLSQLTAAEMPGHGISEWKAGKCLEIFHASNPHIKEVFWAEIQAALRNSDSMRLVSPHGRQRQFFERWGDDMFKEAYSYIPQATVSDHTKWTAIRVEERAPWIEMIIESHDSFTTSVPIERKDEAIAIMIQEYERPINFSKCSLSRDVDLVIPAEIQIGYANLKEMKKYDLPKAA